MNSEEKNSKQAFTLSVVTPQKKWVTDLEVEEVQLPAFRGQLTILPGHAPLVTTLSTGLVCYREKGSEVFSEAVISWGYCEVFPSGVNILAETVETAEDLDMARVRIALKKSEDMLSLGQLDPDGIIKFQRKVQRARMRLQLVNEQKDH